MKLNKKVPVLILPVLLTSFFIIATGLYVVERNSVDSLAQSSVEMEAAELAGSFTQYSLVARGFVASLIQSDALRRFVDSGDEHIKSLALGSGLDSVLNSLTNLSSDHFSIIFIRGDGTTEYYYENSLDPFAEPDPVLMEWADKLLKEGHHSSSRYLPERNWVAISRILNRQTLKTPLDFLSPDTLAIIVTLSPTDFLHRSGKLGSENRVVSFFGGNGPLPVAAPLEARRQISGFGTISVRMDGKAVQTARTKIFLRMALGFVVLMILTQLVLQWLLRKYVINPINQLEAQLGSIDLNANGEIEIYRSRDEIGSLSTSFAQLYEKLKETYKHTKDLAERDALTELYNRRIFNHTLEKLIGRAEKRKSLVALIYIDIDNFKFVNDTYGHSTGDALLRAFAMRLHEVVRAGDIVVKNHTQDLAVARLAGDEFGVIIHGYTSESAPGKVAGRILGICESGFTTDEGTFPISLSIGVSTYPADGAGAEELIVNADSAMYQSKKSGKNAVSFYSEELSQTARRLKALEVELKQLDVSELELFYMPIVDSETGEIYALEALLRWFSKKLGPVPPAEFIPLAESIGVYQKIDLWVLEQAFSDASMLQEKLGSDIRISINISAAELSQQEFVEMVLALLEKHNVAPSMFTIEITETFYQDHLDTGPALLQVLKENGFQLAIDDLGSGYTSLLQIVEFPVNLVKIDRTFVEKSIAGNKVAMLKSLVELCHSQELLVVAEGVEQLEDVEILSTTGCDYLQGYYFSKPMPPVELVEYWLQKEDNPH